MSDDLIKRADAIEAITYSHLNVLTKEERELLIQDIPSADRPQGEWIEHKWIEYNEKCMLEMPMHNYECSKCHSIFYEVRETNFCPNCGSRMKGADDEYEK